MKLVALVSLLPLAGAFVAPSAPASKTALHMKSNEKNTNGFLQTAAAAMAAAVVAVNTIDVPLASAATALDFGSTQMVAARSGGRAGGRSSMSRMSSSPSRMSSSPSSTRVIERRTTVVTPPSVVVTPGFGGGFYGGYGYGYNPGLGLGLGLVNEGLREVREFNQEREIRDTRGELMRSQAREAELNARLNALENAQNLTPQQQQLYMMQLQQQQMALQQQQQQLQQVPAAVAPQ